jgi:hypothetical protein
MLVQEPCDHLGPHLTACARRVAEQHVSGGRVQLTPEPACDRDAEAGLAPARDLRRKRVREGAPECHLAAPTVDLERLRQ